jgi:hypothetical protein
MCNKIDAGNVLLRAVGGVIDRHEVAGPNGARLVPIINLLGKHDVD